MGKIILKELIKDLDSVVSTSIAGSIAEMKLNSEVTSITSDSRRVIPGSVFFAINGSNLKGSTFIEDALKRGAIVAITDDDVNHDNVIKCADVRREYANALSKFYNHPQRDLNIVAVTGTNGKSSCAWIMSQLSAKLLGSSAYIGTIGYLQLFDRGERSELTPNSLTTPDSADLYGFLSECKQKGITHIYLEATAHAIEQHRLSGIEFIGSIFTNLTQDHLDYFHTMDTYYLAKEKLFTDFKYRSPNFVIANCDDLYARRILNHPNANFARKVSVSTATDFCDRTSFEFSNTGYNLMVVLDYANYYYDKTEIKFSIHSTGESYTFMSPLIGSYNVDNLLYSIMALSQIGFSFEDIIKFIPELKTVPGRLENVSTGKISVFIDYAHSPDGLKCVLESLNKIRHKNPELSGKIITVFGCGGDRDKTKRPIMGDIAARLSDVVIITSDNPRKEDPAAIISDIQSGITSSDKIFVEVDRKEAIRNAIESAKEGDVVLIAGKGHEDYQIIGDQTVHFSDHEIVRLFLG